MPPRKNSDTGPSPKNIKHVKTVFTGVIFGLSQLTLQSKPQMNEFQSKGHDLTFGLYLAFGGMHPGKRGLKYTWVPYIVLVTVVMILLTGTILRVNSEDLSITSECIHFLMFFVIITSIVISFVWYKDKVDYIFETIGKDFYDYQGTLDTETINEMEILSTSIRKRRQLFGSVFRSIIVGAYFSTMFARPLISYMQSEDSTSIEGMYVILPVPFWLPMKKHIFWNLCLYVLSWIIATYSLWICCGHNLFFLAVGEEIALSLKALGLSMRRLSERADEMPHLPREEALLICVKHSIRHHQVIIRFVRNFESVIYFPSLVFIAGSTILLCMSAFLLLNDEVHTIAKVIFILFGSAELIACFIYCNSGERIQNLSTEIRDEVYASKWLENSLTLKRYLLIIQTRARPGLTLSAGGFNNLNHETYSNILSAAFSYFNLMNAIH